MEITDRVLLWLSLSISFGTGLDTDSVRMSDRVCICVFVYLHCVFVQTRPNTDSSRSQRGVASKIVIIIFNQRERLHCTSCCEPSKIWWKDKGIDKKTKKKTQMHKDNHKIQLKSCLGKSVVFDSNTTDFSKSVVFGLTPQILSGWFGWRVVLRNRDGWQSERKHAPRMILKKKLQTVTNWDWTPRARDAGV